MLSFCVKGVKLFFFITVSSCHAIVYLVLYSPDITAGSCLKSDTEWKIFIVTVYTGFALTTLLQDVFKSNILISIPLFFFFFFFLFLSKGAGQHPALFA